LQDELLPTWKSLISPAFSADVDSFLQPVSQTKANSIMLHKVTTFFFMFVFFEFSKMIFNNPKYPGCKGGNNISLGYF
jgi:hypothetical protein